MHSILFLDMATNNSSSIYMQLGVIYSDLKNTTRCKISYTVVQAKINHK